MTSIEIRGGGKVVAAGGGGIDPSNLHLKKELTQIRRAARLLRDPGTSSTWPSPVNTARSLSKQHYVKHHKNGQIDGNANPSSSEPILQLQLQTESNIAFSNGNTVSDKNVSKEKRVFLYNWRSQKSESEKSKRIGENYTENCKDEGSSSTQDDSADSRNGCGNDSKSENYLSDMYASEIFKRKDSNFTPSIRRTIKKKAKRGSYSSACLRHYKGEAEKQMLLNGRVKRVVDGLGLGRDDSVDQSDGTEDYCNSEDLRRAAAISPLLARIKNKGWAHSPSKLLRSKRKEDDSISYSTPALSTSSYNKYGIRNPSTVESWDATTGSMNYADDEVDDQLDLPGRQGCGIPCYWSKRSTPKSRIGYGSSPSLSDTLMRKGSSILCGNQTMRQRRRQSSSFGSTKRRLKSKAAAQGLVPLLVNRVDGRGGSSMGNRASDDDLNINFPELDLEALSRLDGRRWSTSCRSQEGLELVEMNREVHEESSPENGKSLSEKYRPMFFEELIGQNIVVQSLMNAISRRRIAPVYLFHGPRGTGKTSTARIFSASLNCLSTEESNKPCGVCRECTDIISGKNRYLIEVDGSNKKGIDNIKNLLKNLSGIHLSSDSQYRFFVIDECHLLSSKTWQAFLCLLEKPFPRVVFVLVTTDIDNVPRTVLSRCQKHLFNKISNGDIVGRLRKIAADEDLNVASDALDIIASNADGSLRDAETMLDQLSLFGKRMTVSLVNELIGVVSDEKLLDLLELAMSSNATETVIRARELMDSGVDPIVLMSQMATLIVDIIAGTYPSADIKHNDSFFGGKNLSERELERLKHALTLLSEAEKHLRVSSERSTWFTATLLQLDSLPSSDQTHSGSSRRRSSKATEEDRMSVPRDASVQKQRTDARSHSLTPPQLTSGRNSVSQERTLSVNDAAGLDSYLGRNQFTNSDMLTNIWLQCIEKCHSKTLKQLLHSYGKLVSISEVKGSFVAHIAFTEHSIKTRAEGFLSSITNSFEVVLRHSVEVRIVLLPDSLVKRKIDKTIVKNLGAASAGVNSDLRIRSNVPGAHQMEPLDSVTNNPCTSTSEERKPDVPVQRIESIIREQRLETAWLQAMEKGTPGSLSRLKPERNQILPQDGPYNPQEMDSANSEDELNHEMKALKINDGMVVEKDRIVKRADRYPISPSLLHNSSFASNVSKDNVGYESGSGAGGCSGMLCWNNSRPPRRPKAKERTQIHGRKTGRFSLFGECAKSRRTESRQSR